MWVGGGGVWVQKKWLPDRVEEQKIGFGRAAAENFGFSRFKRRFGSFGERKREREG